MKLETALSIAKTNGVEIENLSKDCLRVGKIIIVKAEGLHGRWFHNDEMSHPCYAMTKADAIQSAVFRTIGK